MVWNQTITLFHKEVIPEQRKEVWSSCVFQGVSAVRVQRSSPFGSGMEPDNQLIVRIPASLSLTIGAGDRIVLGEAEISGPISESAEFQKAFLVLSVSDNRRGSGELWHYKVVCQ